MPTSPHHRDAALARARSDRLSAGQLRAQADGNRPDADQLHQRAADAASPAIAARARLSAIADAERAGRQRAHDQLGADYDDEVLRADRLGLPHRESAAAAAAEGGGHRASDRHPA